MLEAVTWVDLAAFLGAIVTACGVGYGFGFWYGRVHERLFSKNNGNGKTKE